MLRRLFSISIILGLLLLGLLLASNQRVFALTATPWRTPTSVGDIGYRTISGKVTNASTGAPIAGATVTCSHFSYSSTGPKCTGTRTTATDGTYSFGSVFIRDTDSVTVNVQATGYTTQSVVKGGVYFLSTLATVNVALVSSTVITSTPTATVTPTPTFTPSPTAVTGGVCSPTTIIAAPFTKDGAGTFCWQSANLGTYMNSWNLTSLTINGMNVTNTYIPASSYPAKVGGYWYLSYNGLYAWSHFEAK